jgi:hypothetical protein
MLLYGPLSVSTSGNTQLNTNPYPDTRGLIITNESPYMLQVTLSGISTFGVTAQTETAILVPSAYNGSITLSCLDYLATSKDSPSYVAFIQSFSVSDSLYQIMAKGGSTGYPIALPRSVSSNLSTNTTNAISNTGNPPLTNFIFAQPTDVTSPTWNGDTSGNLTIKSDNAGTLVTLLQLIAGSSPSVKLAAASIICEILGSLQVDGQITLGTNGIIGGTNTLIGKTTSGDILDAGSTSDTYLKSVNNVNIQINGTTQVQVSSSGLRAINGAIYGTDTSNTIIQSTGSTGTGNTRVQNTDHISLQVPGGSEQLGISSTGCTFAHSINLVNGSLGQLKNFSGTGNGTVATGITNPTAICFNPCTVSGSTQTIGGTTSSSSVVTTGAGLSWSATAWHN